MINRALREVFSNFLAIAWSANTGAVSRVPWHGAIGLSFMVVPAIAGMSV